MTIDKTTFKEEVRNLENRVQSHSFVEAQADKAQTDLTNSVETLVGNTAQEVNGGIKSLTSKATSAGQKLQTASVEGLVTDGVESLKNSIDETIESFTGSFGSKVSVEWSAPDSDGHVRIISETLIADTNSTLAAALSLITGLGVKSGFVQNVVANASPAGVKSTLTGLAGKVGSFASVDVVNQLAETANTAMTDVSSSFAALPALPAGANNISANIDDMVTDVSNSVTSVQSSITKGVEVDQTKLETTLAGITGKSGDIVNNSVENLPQNINELSIKTDNYTKGVDASISNSKSGLLQGFGENLSKDATNQIKQIAPGLSDSDINDAITLAQDDQGSLDAAVEIVSKKSGSSPQAIKSILERLNTTIAGSTIVDASQSVFIDPLEIGRDIFDENNKKVYTYITTVEELEADLRQVTRDITEVVVHWTETFTNKDIGSSEINEQQIALGQSEIGYHYIIRRDGSIQRGRNLNVVGQHAAVNDHDTYSIGIAFVGGFNCASGTDNPQAFLSSSSLTRVQMNSFETFCRAFYSAYPGGQVIGHNDIDDNELDPGFDVRDYCLDMFGKPSLFKNTTSQKPFTPAEINSTKL